MARSAMEKISDDKDQRWQDQSKRNKVSSGGEAAFLIVGSDSTSEFRSSQHGKGRNITIKIADLITAIRSNFVVDR
jgi:hypothetical protein